MPIIRNADREGDWVDKATSRLSHFIHEEHGDGFYQGKVAPSTPSTPLFGMNILRRRRLVLLGLSISPSSYPQPAISRASMRCYMIWRR
jgi:hypothetical protein